MIHIFKLATATDSENPIVHDLQLNAGQFAAHANEQSEITQNIKTRLWFVRGEWYQDQTLGVPWREELWAKGITVARIEQIMRQVIEGTAGIVRLEKIQVAVDSITREATVDFTAVTDAGGQITIEDLDTPFVVNK